MTLDLSTSRDETSTARTIWKYELEMRDATILSMPKGAVILGVQIQAGTPQLWAWVNPDKPKEPRYFRLAGTGHTLEAGDGYRYVGSFQLFDGGFVGHVLEAVPDAVSGSYALPGILP